MNHFSGLFLPSVSKVLLALILMLVSVSPATGLAFQRYYHQPTQVIPSYASPTLQVKPQPAIQNKPQPAIQNLPPGATTRVLPDGRIAIVTPFSKEKIRELKRREAERLRIRKTRTQELTKQGKNKSLFPRLPGEFEKTKAIILSICDWQPHNFDVLIDLIEKTRGHANLLLLYNDDLKSGDKDSFSELLKKLLRTGKDYRHIRFLNSNLDTIWLRDFGPRLIETEDGTAMVLDFFYDAARQQDDLFPKGWANRTGAPRNLVPWSLQGGNLLANGRGLAIATTRLFEDNRLSRPGKDYLQDEAYVKQQFMQFCNIKELTLLKPLEQEVTRHVDMFATFLAKDLVLVAQLDPKLDPQNASILNGNAKLLSRVKVDGRPLRVERVWIPPRRIQHWSTYTNIILTDRLVLIPTYQSDPPAYLREATKTYRRLLPKHSVKTIDMSLMDRLGGSLHCLSCPIPSFAKLPPKTLTFQEAVAKQNLRPARKRKKPNQGQRKPTNLKPAYN